MKVVNFYLFISSLLLAGSLQAQQLPLFSEYTHNASIINPGMTGWENLTAVTAGYRHQWTGMPEAPRTAALSFRHFSEKNNMGFGGYLMHDQTGPTSFTGLTGTYAYHLKFKNEGELWHRSRLCIGLSLSAMQYRLRGSDLLVNDMNDDLLFTNNESKILPDAGLGIFYYNDLFYAGFSVPQMVSLKVKFEGNNGLSNIRRIAHFYANAGAKIEIKGNHRDPHDSEIGTLREDRRKKKGLTERKEQKHFIMPSLWIKYAPSSPINAHLNIRYLWDQVLGFGLGYTTDGTLICDFNVHIKKHFRLGYAFSIGVNGLAKHIGSNHELTLTYVIESSGKGWLFPKTDNYGKEKKPKDKKVKEKTDGRKGRL